MWRSLTGCLLLSVLLTSCGLPRAVQYSEGYKQMEGQPAVEWVMYPQLHQFDASFTRKETQFNGIFYFKSSGMEGIKIAMTTDMGYKLFDLFLTHDSTVWNYVYPDLDKKLIRTTLEKDLRTLLLLVPQNQPSQHYSGNPRHEYRDWKSEKIYFYPNSDQWKAYDKIQLIKNNKIRVEVRASNFQECEVKLKDSGNVSEETHRYLIPNEMILEDYLAKTKIELKRRP